MKKSLSVIFAILMVVTLLPFAFATEKETVILYTNDVHCAIDDYPVLAAYRAELIAQGKNVVTVDAGDAIQGEIIGSLTEGEAVVDIMNAVGYDYAAPGNHEFDYGVDNLVDLAENKAEYDYISSNFYYLPDASPVFESYAIEDFGSYQVAFVGISTPDTITSSSPEYFKDGNGDFIYGFPKNPSEMTNKDFYENVQESVDKARADGADIVVAVGHVGILGSTEGWKSSEVIANTDGIDYFIDAHSHETTVSAVHKNRNNEDVILTSTGDKFRNFGVLTIGDTAEFELVNPDNVNVETMSDDAKSAYNSVKAKVDGYVDEISYLFEEIGTSEANLIIYDDNGNRIIRNQETNAGDFVADAYRAITGADVAIANGGGIRAEVEIGGVSRKNLMDVNAYNNDMCVVEVTGQQLLDVLEHGARKCPVLIGGFFQVSGVTFEIHTYRKTPVICDQLDNFIGMDEFMDRRVQNVLVGGKPVEPDKTYTLAGSQYVLTKGGDGLTMLDGVKVVQEEGLPCDSEMLIEYFTKNLGGVIPADKYGNPDGEGRIVMVSEHPNAPECEYEIAYGETLTVTAEPGDAVYVKFVPEKSMNYVIRSESENVDTGLWVFDSDLEEVFGEYYDDSEEDWDFYFKGEFEAGKTYYLNIFTYSDKTETFDIVIECGHSYANGVCSTCGAVCSHSEIYDLGYCECGEVFLGTDIYDGYETVFNATEDEGPMWLRVTPEESGAYIIKSVSADDASDLDCNFFASDGVWYGGAYDSNGLDFEFICDLEAGETYYFQIMSCTDETLSTVKFSRATHVAADGSEHKLEYDEGISSTCIEHGYSDGLYCTVCDEFICGHEELELDWIHPDEDGDEICDYCGAEIDYSDIFPDEECYCFCHSDNPFLSFIWKIANFFHSIFGIFPECDCGEEHHGMIFFPPFVGLF